MKRLQFLMPDERLAALDALVEELGMSSRTDLLNSAISLYEWAVRERQKGRIVVSYDEEADWYKEVIVSGFPAISKPAPRPEASRKERKPQTQYPASEGLAHIARQISEAHMSYQAVAQMIENDPTLRDEIARGLIAQKAGAKTKPVDGR